MKRTMVCVAVCLLQALALAQSTQPSTEQALTVKSLNHSSQSLVESPAAPRRAGRLVTLVKYTRNLDADNPQTQALTSDIYEIQGDLKSAGELALRRLLAQPDNYDLGLSYLRLNMATKSNSKERLEFLQSAAGNARFAPYLRAEALAQVSQILLGQDQKKAALGKLHEAIKLDPLHSSVLAELLNLKDQAGPLDQARTMLELIQADPNDTGAAWQMATLLDSMAMYDDALLFYNYGWELTRRFNPQVIDEATAVQYFNGLLDAGQARKAIEVLLPLRKKLGDSPEFKSLLVETYRQTGDAEKADSILGELKLQLGDRDTLEKKSLQVLKENAWYYLINNYFPHTALVYARDAAKLADPSDDLMKLILCIAELKAGDAVAGESGLKKLLDKDIYAAWFLADYYYSNNKPDEGKKALLAGAKLSRRGRAFRAISAMAKRQDVTIPPPPDAREIADTLAKFDKRYLSMGLSPESFVSVKLTPAREEFVPGDPIELDATLTNTSELDVPVGQLGLFSPAMSLTVNLGSGQEFVNFPMVVWPAGRYLKAGQSLTATVRLDVGPLEEYLVHHPLDTVTLKVSATLDPVQKGASTSSMLPTFDVAPVSFRRGDILVEFDRQKGDWAQAYDLTLGYIVKDLKQGELRERMTAARKIGSLLTLVGDVNARQATPPTQLMAKVKQPVLLAMLKAAMEDASPAVRAEMLNSLIYCRPDANILRWIKPACGDKSELVRLRMAELLGVSGQLKVKAVAARFSAESNPWVKQMLSVFNAK